MFGPYWGQLHFTCLGIFLLEQICQTIVEETFGSSFLLHRDDSITIIFEVVGIRADYDPFLILVFLAFNSSLGKSWKIIHELSGSTHQILILRCLNILCLDSVTG